MPLELGQSYAHLPDRFFARLGPAPAPAPQELLFNAPLAHALGLDLDTLAPDARARLLTGQSLPANAAPIAMAYAGHQFGNFVPSLGDGRAILLGEIQAPDGTLRDLHLKGAGRTPFSRGGDGKAALGPVLREYIVSDAMAALGIPTSRALAACSTGETVWRETPQPGAILARVASSHIRVGTFQYFLARRDTEALQALLDHAIARHAPDCATAEIPALAFFRACLRKQAALVAGWMRTGFIHGVMNTDNMAVSGETIDYGPCAFLDIYDPGKVFSSIDRMGRYAFANQPNVAHWNLAQLAQSLLPLMPGSPEDAAGQLQSELDVFPQIFAARWLEEMGAKLGLRRALPTDKPLVDDFLTLLHEGRADYTRSFTALARGLASGDFSDLDRAFGDPVSLAPWLDRWHARLATEDAPVDTMQAANPVRIARNHQVEHALVAAENGNLDPARTLIDALKQPYCEDDGFTAYEAAPAPGEIVQATFCGT